MAVTVICPNLRCRGVLRVPDDVRGKKVRCGRCGKNFVVPEKCAAKKKAADPSADEASAAGKR